VGFQASLPVLVVEWSKEGVKAPACVRVEDKICFQRWKTIQKIAFIPLGAIRLYAISSLHNSLHYEIPFSEVSHALSVVQKLEAHGNLIKIVILDGISTFQDEDLICRYDLPLGQIQNICWDHLNQELSKFPSHDDRRNTTSKDYGFCGWKNAARETESSGLAHPRMHSGTDHPKVRKTFMALSEIIATHLPNIGGEVYSCSERNRHFAGTIKEGNTVETVRHASGIVCAGGKPVLSNFLGGHCDQQNEKENPRFMWVCSVSMALYSPSSDSVSAHKLITYGKAAAGQFVKTHDKYSRHLLDIKQFWESMAPNLKSVTNDLFEGSGNNQWTVLTSPHSMKTVLYSVHAAAIRRVVDYFPFMLDNPWYILALLFCVLASNCPQHFFNECNFLVSDPNLLGDKELIDMTPIEFAKLFYRHLFLAKSTASYPTVARRQPSSNIAATDQQIENSILSLARMVIEARRVPLDDMNKNTRYYYQRCVANLCQDCPKCPSALFDPTAASCSVGVFSAGSLTAQELIGVGAVLGVLPLSFAYMAEIGHTTGTFRYLVDKLDNSPFTDDNHLESTTHWIKAVCHLLKVTAMQAEELTCKWVQFMSGTTGRYRDSIPPGIEIIYPLVESPQLLSRFPDGSIVPTLFLQSTYDFSRGWLQFGNNFHGDSAYWEVKPTNWTKFSSRKAHGSRIKEPSVLDFFPLRAPAGFSISAAKASGKMQLPTLSPQAVVLSMDPPLPGHKQKLIDAVTCLSIAKFGVPKADHKSLFCIAKCRFQKGKSRRKRSRDIIYFSVGIKMRGGTFDQYEASTSDIYHPPEGFLLRRGGAQSILRDKCWWFADLDEAKDYSCLSLIFDRPYLFANVRSLWEHLLVSNPPPTAIDESGADVYSVDSILSFNVLTHSKNRKKPLPHMVCVRYSKGGLAYYLVDDIGNIDSELVVRLPRSKANRKSATTGKEEKLDFIDIVGHSTTKSKSKAITLCVLWSDGIATDEPLACFAKDNYYSVYRYVIEKRLQNEIGWKRYCRCNQGKKLVITPTIQDFPLQKKRPKRQRSSDDQKFGVKNSFSDI
jgi:hypothetical protein